MFYVPGWVEDPLLPVTGQTKMPSHLPAGWGGQSWEGGVTGAVLGGGEAQLGRLPRGGGV